MNTKFILSNNNSSSNKHEGGGKMVKKKPFSAEDMTFVEEHTIPKRGRGRSGRNWSELLGNIPEGQAWRIPEDADLGFTLNAVKSAVKEINKESETPLYTATQRTEEGKVVLYILKIVTKET